MALNLDTNLAPPEASADPDNQSTASTSEGNRRTDNLLPGDPWSNGPILGTRTDNRLSGTEEADIIRGRAGDDRIDSYEGDDVIYGGAGDDLIVSGNDDDWVSGGLGDDIVVGGFGDDTIYGKAGDDELHGDQGNDWLSGGRGDDALHGGDGDDEIYGGVGNDALIGGDGADIIYGQAGDDEFLGGEGDDELYGGGGNDIFYSTDSNDHDIVDGGAGNDTIDFRCISEDLTIDLANGTATVGGREFVSMTSIENVVGSAGNDTITGNQRDNVIDGGKGDDWFQGGKGADTLTGGDGADTFFWAVTDIAGLDGSHYGLDVITDFDATEDILDLSYLIYNLQFNDISDFVSLEETNDGTIVSVDFGVRGGVQQVALLEDVFNLDVNSLYDNGALLA